MHQFYWQFQAKQKGAAKTHGEQISDVVEKSFSARGFKILRQKRKPGSSRTLPPCYAQVSAQLLSHAASDSCRCLSLHLPWLSNAARSPKPLSFLSIRELYFNFACTFQIRINCLLIYLSVNKLENQELYNIISYLSLI